MKRNFSPNADSTAVTNAETVRLLRERITIPTVDPPYDEIEAAIFVRRVLEKEALPTSM